PLTVVFTAQAWYAKLEEVALAALDVRCTPDDIERALDKIPFPSKEAADQAVDNAAQGLARWWQTGAASSDILVLPDVDAMLATLAAMAERIVAATASGKTLWWSAAKDTGTTELHCLRGMPPESYFLRLLQGAQRA